MRSNTWARAKRTAAGLRGSGPSSSRRPQHPRPRFSGESAVWFGEHTSSGDPARHRFGLGETLAVDV